MQVATLDVDVAEARSQYAYYRAAVREGFQKQSPDVRRRLLAEFKAAQAIVWHATKGRRILKLGESMRLAGLDERKRPRLAIARADREFVWAQATGWGNGAHTGVQFFQRRQGVVNNPHRVIESERVDVRLPGVDGGRLRAVVPNVPPHLMPRAKLEGFWILFEARWEPVAPPDPLLLRRIDGDAFAVVAQWDLTPVEKLVLERRFS